MTTVKEVWGIPPIPNKSKLVESKRINNSTRYFGVEVELEGLRAPLSSTTLKSLNYMGWAIKDDHSLRNYGKEFVFSTPLRGRSLEAALLSLEAGITSYVEAGGNVRYSSRTSTHIHVDMTEQTLEELQAIIAMFILLEPIIWYVSGRRRKNSQYCVPIKESPEHYKHLGNFLVAEGDLLAPLFNSNLSLDSYKYSSINFAALRNYGTLEIRTFCATYKAGVLLLYVNLLNSIVDLALSLGGAREVKEFIFDVVREGQDNLYSTLLNKVLPKEKSGEAPTSLYQELYEQLKIYTYICSLGSTVPTGELSGIQFFSSMFINNASTITETH